jgi:Uma2 family endonuclease
MDMTLAAPSRCRTAEPNGVQLSHVSWEGYESLLKEVGDRLVYITYDQGRMEIMSPTVSHEVYKRIIGLLIETLAEELNVPILMSGSATFRRKDLAKGLEPDESYYIGNIARVQGKKHIRLPKDPPPDLVVEVDISHHGIQREALYAAMGVPEIWRFDGTRLQALVLSGRDYRPSAASLAFPSVQIRKLERFVKMANSLDATHIRKAFREWVRRAMRSWPAS